MTFLDLYLLRHKCLHCDVSRFQEGPEPETELYSNIQDYADFQAKILFRYIPIIPRLKLFYSNLKYSDAI
jgi:hypothetical protein